VRVLTLTIPPLEIGYRMFGGTGRLTRRAQHTRKRETESKSATEKERRSRPGKGLHLAYYPADVLAVNAVRQLVNLIRRALNRARGP